MSAREFVCLTFGREDRLERVCHVTATEEFLEAVRRVEAAVSDPRYRMGSATLDCEVRWLEEFEEGDLVAHGVISKDKQTYEWFSLLNLTEWVEIPPGSLDALETDVEMPNAGVEARMTWVAEPQLESGWATTTSCIHLIGEHVLYDAEDAPTSTPWLPDTIRELAGIEASS